MKMGHKEMCSVLAVFWVDGCVTWKVLRKLKVTTQHGTRMEVTSQKCDLFLVVKSGVGWKKGEDEGGTNWFEENYTIVNGATTGHKRTPQKAYRFKGTLMVEGDQWCVGEANWEWLLVSTMCGIASVVPQTVPNQIWDVFRCQNELCMKLPPLGLNSNPVYETDFSVLQSTHSTAW